MSEFCSRTGGYVSAFSQQVFEAAGAACSQALQGLVPPLQLNCLRVICQMLFSILILILQKGTLKADRETVPFILASGFLMNVTNICFFTASGILPLGTLISLDRFSALVTTVILNKIIFNKTMNSLRVFPLLAVFLGIFLLTEPEFISRANILNCTIPDNYTFISNETLNGTESSTCYGKLFSKETLGLILGTVAGIVGGLSAAVNRWYLGKIPTMTLTFWLAVLGVYPSLVFMFYFEKIVVQFSKSQMLMYISHACSSATACLLRTFSQQNISPLAWAMIDCCALVFGFILQYTLMKHVVHVNGNPQEFAGALIIFFGVVIYAINDFKEEEDQRLDI